jgi:hypothetical protein
LFARYVMVAAELAAGVTSLKLAKDVLMGLLALKVDEEARLKVSKALDAVLSAQDSLSVVMARLLDVQTQLAEVTRERDELMVWQATVGDYVLKPTSGGAVVYESRMEPHHLACPACWSERKAVILQSHGPDTWPQCPVCKMRYRVSAHGDGGPNLAITDYDPYTRG